MLITASEGFCGDESSLECMKYSDLTASFVYPLLDQKASQMKPRTIFLLQVILSFEYVYSAFSSTKCEEYCVFAFSAIFATAVHVWKSSQNDL